MAGSSPHTMWGILCGKCVCPNPSHGPWHHAGPACLGVFTRMLCYC